MSRTRICISHTPISFPFTPSPFIPAAPFARSSCDRCLCQGALLRSHRPFPPSHLATYTRTRAHVVDACTCIYQNRWHTGYAVLVRNTYESRGRRESTRRHLGLRISACTLRSLQWRRPESVGVLYNTRACRAQANRRAYSSREKARRLFRYRLLVVVGSSSRDGNYSNATCRKIQGHDYLVCSMQLRTYDWSRKTRRLREAVVPNHTCSQADRLSI